MIYVKKVVLFIVTGIILALCGSQSADAQPTDIDENRMNRDIKIMDNILQEMFKTRWETRGSNVYDHSGGIFSFGGSHNPHGTYLPGYGIIFTIQGGRPGFAFLGETNGGSSSFNFEYGNDENGEKVTEESITNKIVEFLQNYGSTIGQLSDNDKVMVIYNANKSRHFDFNARWISGKDEEEKQPKIPTISVVSSKKDLQTYRAGDISSDELRSRLEISTAGMNDHNQMDLKVMANILETTLKEPEEGSFRITGSVDYLMLDNFGALFFCEASFLRGLLSSAVSSIMRSDINSDIDSIIDSIHVHLQKKNRGASVDPKSGNKGFDSRDEREKKRKEEREKDKKQITESYQAFVSSLKESLVDYGRTLRSVGSDQYILVSVSLGGLGRYDEVPERIDMQVLKSTLVAVEKGNINREEAIDQIQVREY